MAQSVLYNALISLYSSAVQFAGKLGNQKAADRFAGQHNALKTLYCSKQLQNSKNTLWFHCASMGEYEQGRPIMEALKKQKPSAFILVTYFSPSGYNHHKPDDIVDLFTYLPDDTPQNAKHFIKTVNPKLAVFIKYEFWKNYIDELHQKKIPLIYTSAIFRAEQPVFQFYGKPLLQSIKTVDYFFVQNRESSALLKARGIEQTEVAGDVRFDRALQTTRETVSFPFLEKSFSNTPVIIFGSAWQKEIDALERLINNRALKDWKIIAAPHDISKATINKVITAVKNDYQLFSDCQKTNSFNSRVLIVDTIGDLKHLYQYGNTAVIGGGFNDGIHNIIEPAAFGIPVFFGPKNKKFPEAAEMKEIKTGFEFNDIQSLEKQIVPFVTHREMLKNTSENQEKYVKSRTGASGKITNYILSKLAQIPKQNK